MWRLSLPLGRLHRKLVTDGRGRKHRPRTLTGWFPKAPFQNRLWRLIRSGCMELAIQIQVEELPEGLFLATSDQLPGLVAQGRTVAEALEIARDVARKLIEARREREGVPNLPTTSERRDYTIVVAA